MKRFLSVCGVALLCVTAAAAQGGGDLARTIGAMVAEPAVARAHWGISVVRMDGMPIYALNDGQLFQPASTAKLFTTTAAMALLGPQKRFETKVIAEGIQGADGVLRGNLVLKGGGDANFGGTDLPYLAPGQRPKETAKGDGTIQDIEALADAVVAKGLHEVRGDVVGDDTAMSWEPIPPDWAADDLIWGYGAPVSALTIHHNEVDVHVSPNAAGTGVATVHMDPAVPFYTVMNRVVTEDYGARNCDERLLFERASGARSLTVTGDISPKAALCVETLAIDDPAEYAAMALRAALERRGVKVSGVVRARHWNSGRLGSILPKAVEDGQNPLVRELMTRKDLKVEQCVEQQVLGPDSLPQTVLAVHESAPLIEDMTLTNKVSQNLHAELFLRDIGAALTCEPDAKESLRLVRDYLLNAGLDGNDFVFYDGSGLSGHDLVTPRAVVRMLQYASAQPWFAAWRATLPVGGVDGSLAGRFTRAPLKGKVFAKTGTLGEARALSGYVECASGQTVIFSIMVGNHPPQNNADREAMDRIVASIAAMN